MAELTSRDIERLRDDIAAGKTAKIEKTRPHGVSRPTGGEGTAARTLRVFASVCAFGVKRGWLAENPVRGVKTSPSGQRDRVLSADELERLSQALADAERDGAPWQPIAITRLLLATGWRRGEAVSLRWSDVDFDHAFVALQDTKTGRSLRPLTEPARAILAGLERSDGVAWVFPRKDGSGPYTGFTKAFQTIRSRAGLGDDVTAHVVRHTFATMGGSLGAPTRLLQAALGHQSQATTVRYQHPALAEAKGIADAVAERMTKATR